MRKTTLVLYSAIFAVIGLRVTIQWEPRVLVDNCLRLNSQPKRKKGKIEDKSLFVRLIDLIYLLCVTGYSVSMGVGRMRCTMIPGRRSDNCPVRIDGGERAVLASDEEYRPLWLAR
jgi:hypothetical protein